MAVGPPGSLVEMVGRPALLVLAGAILARGQLIGQRGVIGLPDNFEYRDDLTRAASQAAAAFALQFQPGLVRRAHINQVENRRGLSGGEVAFISSGVRPQIDGGNNDNFFHSESRIIRPPVENAERIDNEHPCTNIRSQCDVPEQLLALALMKKVQSPENSDGLVNELVGVEPLTDVNGAAQRRSGFGSQPTSASFTTFGANQQQPFQSQQAGNAFTSFGPREVLTAQPTNPAFSPLPERRSFRSFGGPAELRLGSTQANPTRSFTTFGSGNLQNPQVFGSLPAAPAFSPTPPSQPRPFVNFG